MDRSESKYFNTARLMDEALLLILQEKDLNYVTVKEVCARAGVNRSTFYLHYQGIPELLEECVAYMDAQFFKRFDKGPEDFATRIRTAPLSELVLVTDEYLLPYLEFIRDNRHMYLASLKNPRGMRAAERKDGLVTHVLYPIMDRFQVPQAIQPYKAAFYLQGLNAVVQAWLERGCKEPPVEIAAVMAGCVLPDVQGLSDAHG